MFVTSCSPRGDRVPFNGKTINNRVQTTYGVDLNKDFVAVVKCCVRSDGTVQKCANVDEVMRVDRACFVGL